MKRCRAGVWWNRRLLGRVLELAEALPPIARTCREAFADETL